MTETTTLTEDQREILQLALDYDGSYITFPACHDYGAITGLVSIGLMEEGRVISGETRYYHLTAAGRDVTGALAK